MSFPVISIFRKKSNPVCYFFIIPLVLFGCNKAPEDKRIKQVDPVLAASWAKEIEEQVNPELEEGLTLRIWGPDSLVADPITIDVDDQGHIYYSRTNRRRVSEFDIRSHQDWEIASIGFQSVEDRRAFIHRELRSEERRVGKECWYRW